MRKENSEDGVDGRKFVVALLVLVAIAGVLFLIFKPDRPLGGPSPFFPAVEESGGR